MKNLLSVVIWVAIARCGAAAFGVLALSRGETISAGWLVVAGVCTYLVAYRFYSRYLAYTVFGLDDRRATPAERLNNGRDFVPTNKWVAAGHHFSAISGAGPLVGPTLAAQFGFLPGTIWLIAGVVLGGAVQDMIVLCASVRRDGKSLGQMAKEEVNPVAGMAAMVAVFAIMIILLAVLALVVVNALRDSPWGLFTIAATIPIALLMGVMDEQHPAGQGRGGHRHRHRAADGRAPRRPVGRRASGVGRRVHLVRRHSWRGRSSSTASSRRCCRCGSCWRRATICRRS